MKGVGAQFAGRLGKDAESRATQAGKPMTMLSEVTGGPDSNDWCAVLAFEDLTERATGLAKGAEIHAKAGSRPRYVRRRAASCTSLALLASVVEPMVLERKPPRATSPVTGWRQCAVRTSTTNCEGDLGATFSQ